MCPVKVCDVARVLRVHVVARVLQCVAVCCSVLWCVARVLRARLCRLHVLIRDAFHCDCSVLRVCVVLRCVLKPDIKQIFHSFSAVQSILMCVLCSDML